VDVVDVALKVQNRAVDRFAPLDRAFIDPAEMPWVAELEAHTATMQRELAALLECTTLPSMMSLSDRQRGMGGVEWQSFVMRMFGNEIASASLICPETTKIVNNIRQIDTAMFSVLQPGASIETHCGPSKSELRYHLPLIVPTSDPKVCGLDVGGEVRSWRVGESCMFDDTVDHSAWNLSDQVRVVLFVGCRRPMPTPLAQIIDVLTRLATKGHPDVAEIVEKSDATNRRLIQSLMTQHAAAPETYIDLRTTTREQLEIGQL